MVAILYSEKFLDHDTGLHHPERPARLSSIAQRLQRAPFGTQLHWQSPSELTQRDPLPWIQQVHSSQYIQRVQAVTARGGGLLDMDTPVSEHSYAVACLAVNAWLDGVDNVLQTQQPTWVFARPPGHHAMPDHGMGFCIFSNAAIAAFYALKHHQLQKVAILDWDVHHGNGTQAIVEDHPQIAYCSLHQSPCYPGTGNSQEHGKYGEVLNIPMVPGSGSTEYHRAFQDQVIPFLQDFAPDLLIVSAGFDANRDDPLAEINLQPQDYAFFTQQCFRVSDRILFGLEGGYDLESLSASVEQAVAVCLQGAAA
jgi:acetoin utilization deacetylase AcuC-like enzyme